MGDEREAEEQLLFFSPSLASWGMMFSSSSAAAPCAALTWGASRAFFIERGQDEADPDPALLMVALRVFPLMLVVVINSMLNWIAISGLLGPSIFQIDHTQLDKNSQY